MCLLFRNNGIPVSLANIKGAISYYFHSEHPPVMSIHKKTHSVHQYSLVDTSKLWLSVACLMKNMRKGSKINCNHQKKRSFLSIVKQ